MFSDLRSFIPYDELAKCDAKWQWGDIEYILICRVPRDVETKISKWVRFQFSEGQSDRQVRNIDIKWPLRVRALGHDQHHHHHHHHHHHPCFSIFVYWNSSQTTETIVTGQWKYILESDVCLWSLAWCTRNVTFWPTLHYLRNFRSHWHGPWETTFSTRYVRIRISSLHQIDTQQSLHGQSISLGTEHDETGDSIGDWKLIQFAHCLSHWLRFISSYAVIIPFNPDLSNFIIRQRPSSSFI